MREFILLMGRISLYCNYLAQIDKTIWSFEKRREKANRKTR